MRVGVLPYALNSVDGGFHYELVFLNALAEIASKLPHELVCLTAPENNLSALASSGGLNFRGLDIRPLQAPGFSQGPLESYLAQRPPEMPNIDLDAFRYEPEKAAALHAAGVDLFFQLGPYAHAFAARIPFVMTIYDLNHRLQPEFPEVSAHGEFERREYMFRNTCRYATFVLVDSQTGKSDVLRLYGDLIGEDRVRVLPYYPPFDRRALPGPDELGRIASKYKLPPRYFFYPAQFWRHKNHAAILRAVRAVADRIGETIPIVLCGAYSDYFRAQNFVEIRNLLMQLGLGASVRYLGPVPHADMPALYTLSAGLVMPTFFGPTNIPPLESWHYGRPVITSDIPGMREQCGDAALFADPRSAEDLSRAMERLWNDAALARDLVARGRKRLQSYNWASFVQGVSDVVTDAADRVRTGKTPRFPDGPAA